MDDLLDTRQLRAFLAVARTGSFTAAAKQLHLTQSAISHAIKVLEDSLACVLVQRSARQVLFTRHGRELLQHAEAIEHRMTQAREALRSLDGSPRGTLRIGCTTAASQYILPGVLREFKESFPHYEIKIIPGETPAVLEKLQREELDFGLIIQPEDLTGVQCQPLLEDDIVFAVAPGHPWAAGGSVPFTGSETFIISTRQSTTWQLITSVLRRSGWMPQSIVEVGSSEATRQLALTGYGIGVCTSWTVTGELARGQLVAVPHPAGPIRRTWVSAMRKGRSMNLAERTFLGLCRESARLLTTRMANG